MKEFALELSGSKVCFSSDVLYNFFSVRVIRLGAYAQHSLQRVCMERVKLA